MGERAAETAEYRMKAAHMRKLADQAQNDVARAAYVALEVSWLRLAQKSEDSFATTAHEKDGN